jgi:DNA repair protein RadD
MLGRASRVSEGKSNALVLDFAGNIGRCGAINAPNLNVIGDKSSSKPSPRQCEECGHYEPPHARACSNCGASLIKETPPPKAAPALATQADRNAQPMALKPPQQTSVPPPPNAFRVLSWKFAVHHKAGMPPSLKVEFFLEGYRYRSASMWVTAWHTTGAAYHGQKAWTKLLKAGSSRLLPVSAEAAALVAPQMLERPAYVQIRMENGFPTIVPITAPIAA